MSTWEGAEAAALASTPPPEPVQVTPPPAGASLVVTDHWDLTMLECPFAGCTLVVRPLSKIDAMELAHRHQAPVTCINERSASTIEKELGLIGPQRPVLGRATRLIVMVFVSWQDKRWFLLEYGGDL